MLQFYCIEAIPNNFFLEEHCSYIYILFFSFVQANNIEAELRKAGDEIKRLREEISALRQENLQLKASVYINFTGLFLYVW